MAECSFSTATTYSRSGYTVWFIDQLQMKLNDVGGAFCSGLHFSAFNLQEGSPAASNSE